MRFLKLISAAVLGVAVTLCGLFLGYGIYSIALKDTSPNTAVYAEPKPQEEAAVGKNTLVRYVYDYTEDNEQLFYEELAPEFLQGLTAEEVKKALEGYEVCLLTENRLVVKKTVAGRSSAHYSISEKDGYVAVFFENGILKEKTATPIESLPPELKAKISKGIKVDGREELARYLEELES